MTESTPCRLRANRERIMTEALALAEQVGWNSVTVRAIAKRINYKAPVLYQYFDGKDHLFRAIMERGFKELASAVKDAIESVSTSDEKLIRAAVARFKFASENEALHALMFSTGSPTWQKEMVMSEMSETKGHLRRLLQNISGRRDDCRDLITHFICLIKGYNFFASELPEEMAAREFFGVYTPEESLENAMRMFIKSLRPDE